MKISAKSLFLVLTVVPMNGDTLLTVSQIRPCPTDCVLVTTGGRIEWVELGDHEVVEVEGALVFRNTSTAPAWVKRAEVVLSPQASWVLMDRPIAGSLSISRNGTNLTPGEDWELVGQTVTFLRSNVPRAEDVLDFHYQK